MLPNLIVIGARKCGTSSLYHYLNQHPDITMSSRKELRFFIARHNWAKGLDWYESQFRDASTAVRGEASPQYTSYPRNSGIAERMHSMVPQAKLIYVVGDPIRRLLTHYMAERAEGREERSLERALLPPAESPYVAESSYHLQLMQFLPHYSLERILVLQQEALRVERRATLQLAFAFLEVDNSFDSPIFDRIHNPSADLLRKPGWYRGRIRPRHAGRLPWRWRARAKRILLRPFMRRVERPTLSAELEEEVVRHLKRDVHKLRELTGMELRGWSV